MSMKTVGFVNDRCRIRPSPGQWFWIALAVLAPVFCVATYRSEWIGSPPKPIGDGPDYENLAFHLSQGDGFVLNYTDPEWQRPYRAAPHDYRMHLASSQHVVATGRPPLLPLLIGGIYSTIGRHQVGFAAVRLMLAMSMAIAAAISVYLTAKLLAPLRSNWEVLIGCTTTLAFAVTHRTLREYATDFLTEPIALLMMQLFVLSVWRVIEVSRERSDCSRQTYLPVIVAGMLMGGLILTRSVFVVWLPGVWVLMFGSYWGNVRERWWNACLFVGMACAVCSVWWIRNMVVLESVMPLGTQGPITLLGGYSDDSLLSNGDWQAEPALRLQAQLAETEAYQALENDTQREVMLATEAGRQVRQWIRLHATEIPRLMMKRVYVHWNPYTGRSAVWKLAFLVGIVACIVQRHPLAWWLVGLLVISTGVTAALYSTGGRFLVPLYGVLYTLAGLGVVSVTRATMIYLRRNKMRQAVGGEVNRLANH